MLLHRAVAVRRGVVVDGGAAALDRLGQDRADRLEEVPLVRRPEGRGRAERVEPRLPQRLVGVDVADARDERLVEEERLQPPGAASDAPPEVAQRERRVEGLRADLREQRGAADFRDQLTGDGVPAVQPDLPELADVPEPQLAPVLELQDEAEVRVLPASAATTNSWPVIFRWIVNTASPDSRRRAASRAA